MNESHHRTAVPAANLEPDTRHAPVAEETTPRLAAPVHVRVISYRARKHDPDGVSVKAVLDGIVRTGILADDSTEQIKSVTFESRKSSEEKTIIEIEEIEAR